MLHDERRHPSPRPPRVLQVALSLNPGGTERLLLDIVTRLQPDFPMMVCCLDEPGAWARDLQARGIDVRSLSRRRGFRPALGLGIAKAARAHGATIVHAHHYSPFVYSCLARMWAPSVRLMYTEHGRVSDAPPSAKRRNVNRVLHRLPEQVYAVSQDLKRFMVSEGFSDDAVRVVYNGINVGSRPTAEVRADIRRRLGIPESSLVIGTIARLDPVKDLGTLVQATAMVRQHADAILAVIGDGSERRSLEHAAAESGIASHTQFLGHRDDARDWLPGFDIYVNSSISEGISLTILEAMAACLPIVATRVGGTPEVVDDSCGRLVPPRNPTALSDALLQLAASSDLRDRLAEAARMRVEERFTIQRMVREYQAEYMRLA